MTTMPLAALTLPSLRLLLLGGAAAILYIVGRLVMSAIPRRIDGSSLRAMLGAITILIVSAVAVIMNRPQVGLHLPVAAAAGAMTFGIASILLGRGVPSTNTGFRSWALVLPAVALVLIGGAGGRADFIFLAFLIAYGILALSAWLPDAVPPSARTAIVGDGSSTPTGASPFGGIVIAEASPAVPYAMPQTAMPRPAPQGPVGRPIDSHAFALVVWFGSVALAAIAGMMAMYGLPALESMRRVPADALVSVFLLAPAIVVPIVFELLPPCRPIGWTASVSTVAKFALMCLCVVLPLTILVAADADLIRGWFPLLKTQATTTAATTLPATATSTLPATVGAMLPATQPTLTATPPQLKFPSLPQLTLSTDLLVLAAATLLLLPIAGGWLRPGKLEAAALFTCYVINLTLVVTGMLS